MGRRHSKFKKEVSVAVRLDHFQWKLYCSNVDFYFFVDSQIPGTGRRLFEKTTGVEASDNWSQTETCEYLRCTLLLLGVVHVFEYLLQFSRWKIELEKLTNLKVTKSGAWTSRHIHSRRKFHFYRPQRSCFHRCLSVHGVGGEGLGPYPPRTVPPPLQGHTTPPGGFCSTHGGRAGGTLHTGMLSCYM